jgi:hypothetical protein
MCTRYNIVYISSTNKTDSNHMTEMLLKVALITITVTPWLRQMNQIARIYYPLMRWRLYLVCTVLNITIYATWGGFLKYQVVTLTVHRKTCCSIWMHYNSTLTVYRKTCWSMWIHYNATITVHRKTCCSIWIHYYDSQEDVLLYWDTL